MDGSPEQGNGKAWMDDFAMWDEVLSAQDLTALAAGTVQPAQWIPEPGISLLATLGLLGLVRRRREA